MKGLFINKELIDDIVSKINLFSKKEIDNIKNVFQDVIKEYDIKYFENTRYFNLVNYYHIDYSTINFNYDKTYQISFYFTFNSPISEKELFFDKLINKIQTLADFGYHVKLQEIPYLVKNNPLKVPGEGYYYNIFIKKSLGENRL